MVWIGKYSLKRKKFGKLKRTEFEKSSKMQKHKRENTAKYSPFCKN